MGNKKMRAEFEGYIKDRGHAIDWSSERGVYVDYVVQVAWLSWRDSRAAMVVDLPAMPKAQRSDEEATFSAGGSDMLRKCAKAIEAAGVRVKA